MTTEPAGHPVPGGAGKVVLHVGCGAPNPAKLHAVFRTPEWREVRFDIDPDVQPDIVGSITDLASIATASVHAVWSSHNLEHLYVHEVPQALREFHRVLVPGGFVLITLPDLQRVAELIAADKLEEVAYVSPAGPIRPLDIVYGWRGALARGNHYMAHHTGFTATTLAQALKHAGFADIRVQRSGFDLWGRATKPLAAQRAPEPARSGSP
jgi:ubiquinone/menaquinone biosynthesis C-methylase UbiE